ncbi:hypothetical protein FRB94_013654 [Tulasnella sp. JGI-2019a]|nr:hypothetical protein FRB93_008412 [Tulasnella sp. JGI-2019a]KAG8990198.1 hypothetical protein FRB94_013654 [Tulasnella sp. JGI-2019a]
MSMIAKRLASTASNTHHKVVIVGGGTAGIGAANQIIAAFKAKGKPIKPEDIAIVDAAEWHNYQPGWTLVGSGLKRKSELRRPLASLVPPQLLTLHKESVKSFEPEKNTITTDTGRSFSYDALVVAPGLKVKYDAVEGLVGALADSSSGVSTIYSYDTCDKTWKDIDAFRHGNAIFTQPAGVVKCAGAPQKIMWMAWDRWRRTGRGENIKIDFISGMPTMFSVPKYSEALNALRIERGIGGTFGHDLKSIDSTARKATFRASDGKTETKEYTLLHVTPPQGPHDFVKNSPLADAVGWVDVDPATLQHKKYPNVFSLGDASSLPTSKTAAAAMEQTPVLAANLTRFLTSGQISSATYDGWTSCPLLTEYGKLMLAEFKYGLKPDESFSQIYDQAVPQRAFYYMKRDLFPWAYFNHFTAGRWYGRHAFSNPQAKAYKS